MIEQILHYLKLLLIIGEKNMNLKIGGIYTVEKFKYYLRAAIIIIDKNDEYLFYHLKLMDIWNK